MKKLFAIFMTVAMVLSYTPATVFAAEGPVGTFSVGGESYATLSDAVAVAKEGDRIDVNAAGTYHLTNLPKNVTVEGAVGGVIFDCNGSGSIASVPNGATFENVTMNFGASDYHGFQHAGTINMVGCTLNGKFFNYGDMNFSGCTFNAPGTDASGVANADYSMWAYGGNLAFDNCTFNGAGKFINVYNEGGTKTNVSADGCIFNSTVSKKAAFNVKETSGSNVLNFNVELNNCTCNGSFPAASSSDELVVISGLVQVDDRKAEGSTEGGNIKVYVDGVEVYSTGKAFAPDENGIYHIADAASLVKFMNVVNSGKNSAAKAVLDADIDMKDVEFAGIGTGSNKFSGSFDGNGKTVSNVAIAANGNYAGFFGVVYDADIKNLTLKDVNVSNTAGDYTAALAGGGYARIDGCTIDGGSVTGVEQVGGVIGYLSCGYVNDCTVKDVTVKATVERVGGIAGKANVDSSYEITNNTLCDVTVSGALSAGLIGQVMTAQDRNEYLIQDNTLKNVKVLDENGDDAFNPIGNFRSGSFDPNAVTGGKITGNSWNPRTNPNSYKMVNPADETQFVLIENVNKATVDELEGEIAELKAELEAMKEDNSQLTKRVEELENEIADLEDELEAIKKDSSLVTAANEDLEKRIAELENSLIRSISTTLKVKVKNYNSVKLSWVATGVPDVTYTIYYKRSTSDTWTKFKEVAGTGDGALMTVTKTGLKTGVKYNFYVVPSAMGTNGEKIDGVKSLTVSAKPVPSKTKITKLTKGKTYFKINYKKITGTTRYQVRYRLKTGGKYKYKTTKNRYIKVSKLKSKSTYTVSVRAYRTVNGKRVYGAWSTAKSVKLN